MFNDLKNFLKKFDRNYQAEYLSKQEYLFFNKTDLILDVGTAEGSFIKHNSQRIVGIDTNKESIRICKKKGFNVVLGSALKMPFKKTTFDGVHASHIIEHLYPKDAYIFLKEVDRVLKHKGIFVLSTPLFWNGFYNDFTHVKPYNPESILRYLVYDGSEKTLKSFHGRYKLVKIVYRYNTLYFPFRLGRLLGNYLYTLGVHGLSKNGYTLVLKKI